MSDREIEEEWKAVTVPLGVSYWGLGPGEEDMFCWLQDGEVHYVWNSLNYAIERGEAIPYPEEYAIYCLKYPKHGRVTV